MSAGNQRPRISKSQIPGGSTRQSTCKSFRNLFRRVNMQPSWQLLVALKLSSFTSAFLGFLEVGVASCQKVFQSLIWQCGFRFVHTFASNCKRWVCVGFASWLKDHHAKLVKCGCMRVVCACHRVVACRCLLCCSKVSSFQKVTQAALDSSGSWTVGADGG